MQGFQRNRKRMYRKSIQEGFRKIPAHKDSRLEFLPAKT